MSTHSASSPEPEIIAKKSKKSKDKSSKKSKKAAKGADVDVHDLEVREGSTESSWAYQPPPGSVLLKHDADSGEFDWDTVKDDEDLEIWVMRVPEGVGLFHVMH